MVQPLSFFPRSKLLMKTTGDNKLSFPYLGLSTPGQSVYAKTPYSPSALINTTRNMAGDEPKKSKKSKAKEKRAKAKGHITSLAGGAVNAAGVKTMVEELANKYGKDEAEIFAAYDRFDWTADLNCPFLLSYFLTRFMEKYPTGTLSKRQFSDEMGVSINLVIHTNG